MRASVERRLSDNAVRLRALRDELRVAEDEYAHFADLTDDSRIRALVSETPVSDREYKDAERHSEAMRRQRDEIQNQIEELERLQDELLDQLG